MSYDHLVEKINTFGYLPKGDEWLVSDETGWTVAHVYATSHVLPKDFPYLGVKDSAGWSVGDQAEKMGLVATTVKPPAPKIRSTKQSWQEYQKHSQSRLDECFSILKANTAKR